MAVKVTLGHDGDERLPRWMGEEYGWDTVADVKWDMLRHNLKCIDGILDNPEKFPKADIAKLEWQQDELFVFLASHIEL